MGTALTRQWAIPLRQSTRNSLLRVATANRLWQLESQKEKPQKRRPVVALRRCVSVCLYWAV